jgi:predicted transposase YbfD/YdcC
LRLQLGDIPKVEGTPPEALGWRAIRSPKAGRVYWLAALLGLALLSGLCAGLGTWSLAVRDRVGTATADVPVTPAMVECDYHRTENRGHGRVEIRECWSTSDPEYLNYITTLAEWRGLQSIAMLQAERQLGDQRTVTRRYFISSLKTDAERLLQAVRGHWGIEYQVHWVLDVAFREDDCRIWKGNGAENFAVLSHIALNPLNRETLAKRRSLKGKRKKAAWDEHHLLRVLTG